MTSFSQLLLSSGKCSLSGSGKREGFESVAHRSILLFVAKISNLKFLFGCFFVVFFFPVHRGQVHVQAEETVLPVSFIELLNVRDRVAKWTGGTFDLVLRLAVSFARIYRTHHRGSVGSRFEAHNAEGCCWGSDTTSDISPDCERHTF